MWCNQIFSQIFEGKIQNIIVCDNYEIANYLARCTYGDSAVAVDTTLYPVTIGDLYEEGRFYRVLLGEEGTPQKQEIQRNLSESEQVRQLMAESETVTEFMVEQDYRLAIMELGLS